MADNISALRTAGEEPSLFDQLTVAKPLSQADQYRMTGGVDDSQLAKGLRSGAAGLTAGQFAAEALSQEHAGDADWQRSRDLALQTQQDSALYAPRVTSLRDIGGVSDAVDFATGTIGQGAMSMAPTLAAALLTRGRSGLPAYAGAGAAGFQMEKGEAALGQYADPTLAQTDVDERYKAATGKVAVNAALESIVPGGLANTFLRKPATSFGGFVAKNALEEGLTETAQTGVGFAAEKYLDPNRTLDPMDLADAFVGGALTGGGVSAVTGAPGQLAGAAIDATQNAAGFVAGKATNAYEALKPKGGATAAPVLDTAAPVVDPAAPVADPDIFDQAQEAYEGVSNKVQETYADLTTRYGPQAAAAYENIKERYGPQVEETYGKVKDHVTDFADRVSEATKTSSNPADFLKSVFGSVADDAAADALPDTESPDILNAADPEAAMNERDAGKPGRAARYAEELLNDPNTSQNVKDRVASMQGDFGSPENSSYVIQSLVRQRASEKFYAAANDLTDFVEGAYNSRGDLANKASDLVGRARDKASEFVGKVTDAVTKKNLQDIPLKDIKPLVEVLATKVGSDAPKLARQLMALSQRLDSSEQGSQALDQRLRNFSEQVDDQTVQLVSQLSESEGLAKAMARMKATPSALTDLTTADGNSFMESALVETLAPSQLKQLARVVDDAGVGLKGMNPTVRENTLKGLTVAFGSPEKATAVLEYYGNLKAEAYKLEAEQNTLDEDRPESDTLALDRPRSAQDTDYEGVDSQAEFGTLTERDAQELTASYKNPNPARPFHRDTDRKELRQARREAGRGARVASMKEFVAQSGLSPQVEVARIRADLNKRLREAENRDTASVQQAIKDLQAVPKELQDANFRGLLESLKTRKTEDRSGDLPKLRKQAEAIEKASGVAPGEISSLSRQIAKAERAQSVGEETADTADLPALRKELKKLEARIANNADKVLDRLAVVMTDKDDSFANDRMMGRFREGLDRRKNENKGTDEQKTAAKAHNAKTKKTVIAFTLKNGRTLNLSAESMTYESQARGTLKQRFLDSLAAVRARPDVTGMKDPAPDTIIVRRPGGDLLWSEIAPEARVLTDKQKAALKQKTSDRLTAIELSSEADFTNRMGLMNALRVVQRNYLTKNLPENLQKQVTSETPLNVIVDMFPASERQTMRTEMADRAFKNALHWAKKLSAPRDGRDFKKESQLRVTADYIKEQMNDRFPMPEDYEVNERISAAEEDAGFGRSGAPDGNITADLLTDELTLDALHDRLDAVKGIPSLVDPLKSWIKNVESELDNEADTVKVEKRVRDVPGRPEQNTEAESLKDLRAREARLAKNIDGPDVQDREALDNELLSVRKQITAAERAQPKPARTGAPTKTLMRLRELVAEGNGVLRDGVFFITDADATPLMGGTTPEDAIYVNMGKLRVKGAFAQYMQDSEQKAAVLEVLGVSAEQFASLFENTKRMASFVRDHERSHIKNEDRKNYPHTADGLDLLHPKAIAIEVRATRDALTTTERVALAKMATKGPTDPNDKGTEKQSTVGASGENITPTDKKRVRDEIHRIRGPEVKVAIDKLIKDLGGSGSHTIFGDGKRVIEIAVNAANPMGVAWHESLHDFFAVLGSDKAGRSIKRDLLAATSAPQVMTRLRALLKDHPAAIEQIESSPEERAAYAYQFWAEGELSLGPTGQGMFAKIRQFFRDILGVVGVDQRGLDLLTALHEGKFADPSTVAEVLADMPNDRLRNKVERAAPALTDALHKMLAVAPDRLKDYQNEHITDLANALSSETGELGFIQKRFQEQGKWENKLASILEKSTAVDRRKAVSDALAMREPTTELGHQVAGLFEDLHGYMTEAGVMSYNAEKKKWEPLRKVGSYFPRMWNPDRISANREEFIALLRKHGGMNAGAASRAATALIDGREKRPPSEDVDLGFLPFAAATNERIFNFVNKDNAAAFAKFQHDDLTDITTQYIKQAAHRGEYARAFGNDGALISALVKRSKITDGKDLKDIGTIVQALEGSLDPGHWSRGTKETMSAIMTLQNAVILPLTIFSQMVDPIVLAARSGEIKDAGRAFATALKRLMGDKNVDGEEMAKMLGIISQESVLEAMGNSYGTTHMSGNMRKLNRVFFKYNGMQGWNNSMRIAATAAGERYLISNRKNVKVLAELGLKPEDIKLTEKWVTSKGKNGKVTHELVEGERLDVSTPEMQQAMFRFVDQAVLRPSASSRPVWMSDPRFMLVAHLKQFTFAMQNVVLKRANQQMADGNMRPWAILALTMPVILASDMAKFAMTGATPQAWGFKDMLAHAVNRSGLLGTGDFVTQAVGSVDRGKAPGEDLLGPSFEHLMKILRWIGGDARTGVGDVIDRTVPGARYL